METKINVAKILKNKPEGTKLWTDMFGSVTLYVVTDVCDAFQVKHHNKEPWFDEDGKLYKEGVLCIYPSKSMRDWEKFAWKKGDVLVNSAGFNVFFDRWANDNYTRFFAKTKDLGPSFSYDTYDYTLISKEDASKFVKSIEYLHGGILNLDTLEIEKQPEFKDGDVLFVKCRSDNFIEIFNYSKKNGDLYGHASLVHRTQELDISGKYKIRKDEIVEIRLATEEEKKQLFSVLANEGKAWDAEKKMIVGLKSLWTPKPFDKVLVRNSDADKWLAGFFEKFEKSWNNPYHIMNLHHMTDFAFKQCIPYEGNEHLLGTTKDVEG